MNDVNTIRSAKRAAAILAHPIRTRILHLARQPISASDLARRLGQPRQRVNYHVRMLAREGFLVPAARQKKRNMLEQLYAASASAYVVTPEVLGPVAPDPDAAHDAASAAHLLGLCARAQTEVALVMESANAAGVRLKTFSLQSDIRFQSVEQRIDFTRELLSAVSDVVARHASPYADDYGQPLPGRPFRLIVGCYPQAGTPAA